MTEPLPPIEMAYSHTDPGFCRVFYTCKGRLFCVQEEMRGVYEFYHCSRDEEPIAPIKLDRLVCERIPDPSEYEQGFMDWLGSKGILAA